MIITCLVTGRAYPYNGIPKRSQGILKAIREYGHAHSQLPLSR